MKGETPPLGWESKKKRRGWQKQWRHVACVEDAQGTERDIETIRQAFGSYPLRRWAWRWCWSLPHCWWLCTRRWLRHGGSSEAGYAALSLSHHQTQSPARRQHGSIKIITCDISIQIALLLSIASHIMTKWVSSYSSDKNFESFYFMSPSKLLCFHHAVVCMKQKTYCKLHEVWSVTTIWPTCSMGLFQIEALIILLQIYFKLFESRLCLFVCYGSWERMCNIICFVLFSQQYNFRIFLKIL